jgi:hypothetical protein
MRLAGLVTLLVALTGCRSKGTMLVVEIHSNLQVPTELSEVQVKVTRSGQTLQELPFSLLGNYRLPLRVGLLATAGSDGQFEVRATGFLGQVPVVSEVAIVTFLDRQSLLLKLYLARECQGVRCPDTNADTCSVGGVCRPILRPPGELLPWDPNIPPQAPPIPDGGSVGAEAGVGGDGDASPAGDGGAPADARVVPDGGSQLPTDGATTGDGPVADGPPGDGGCPRIVQVSASNMHACALRSDGTLWCWGAALYGVLGTGAISGQICESTRCVPAPVQVTALGNDVAEVATGVGHTCARKKDGTLWCWGLNQYGQLGNGTATGRATCGPGTGMTESLCEVAPVQVAGLPTDLVAIAAGESHTCARSGDKVWCWGSNNGGELGIGRREMKCGNASCEPTPTLLPAFASGVATLSGGTAHTCARTSQGALWCWGANGADQLGFMVTNSCDGTPCALAPTLAAGLADTVADVDTGTHHTCAVKKDGSVLCWGSNGSGQLGIGPFDAMSAAPAQVMGLSGVAEVSAGMTHTCARKADGSLWCWGSNGSGELGLGNTMARHTCVGGSRCESEPLEVTAVGKSVEQIAVSNNYYTCARKKDGTLWCWGSNRFGMLGIGTADSQPHPTPVQVMGLCR